MSDDDGEKAPYRPPGWLVPYGVAVAALLATAGIACVWPGAPFVTRALGPGAYELTGWFLL